MDLELYSDNTYYSRYHFEQAQNIGWVCNQNKRRNVNVSEDFLNHLWLYIQCPFHTQRTYPYHLLMYKNKQMKLGFSEIRVLGKDVLERYAAPDMIFAYIMEGRYTPPVSFEKAVLEGPKPGSVEYNRYLSRYHKAYLWGEDNETVMQSKILRSYIIEGRNEQVIQMLNQSRETIDIITHEGSILNTAILYGNWSIAEYSIEADLNINKFSGIELVNAAAQNAFTIVSMLFAKNINLDLASSRTNPLWAAVRNQNIDMVKLLLHYGIDPGLKYSNEFMKEMDVLQLARKINSNPIIEILTSHIYKK